MENDKELRENKKPDEKQENWSEVLKMAGDRDIGVRRRAAELISAFFRKLRKSPGSFLILSS